MKLWKLSVTIAVIGLMAACSGNNKPQAQAVSLIYSGNLDGELEPCGCSEQGDLGGLKRRAQLLDDLRQQTPNLIVISSGGLIASEGASDRIKSEFILEGFKALHYDAVALQWKDIAYGPDFLKAQDLPWVSSNWKSDSFAKQRTVTRGQGASSFSLHMYSWLDPAASPMRKMAGEHALAAAT